MSTARKAIAVRRRRPGRPPGRRAANLHDLYLQAALTTFLRHGFEGASIEEIARVARASKMTLYRRYGGKEQLFRHVVVRAIERARNAINIETGDFQSSQAALCGLVRQLHDAFTDATWLGVQRLVIAEGLRFPALAQELMSHDRELLAPVQRFLSEADRRGVLVIPDAKAAAYQLSALASGGVRFLMRKRLRGERRKRVWVDAIGEFAWRSWRPFTNKKMVNKRARVQ